MSALVLPLVLALAAQGAAPVSLRYDASARDVALGDTFQLDLVLRMDGRGRIDELSLPEFAPAFSVVRESRAEMRSGRSVELRFVYLLRAEMAGEQRIGEATARMGPDSARAAPITIRVVGGEEPVSGSDGPAPGARFGNAPPAVFLEVAASQESAWVGQQIVVTTTVYSQQPLAQAPRLPALKPPGFLCVSLSKEEESVTPTQRVLKGRNYYAYVLHKDALFPLEEGKKTLAPVSADVVPAGSLFSRTRATSVRSAPVELHIKPLPTEGKPARCAPGNVGQWRIDASARPSSVTLGQPFSLVVTVSGRGSLESVQVPSWDGGGRARVFPPAQKIERQGDDAVAGRVVMEMLVQPSEAGELRVPSLVLASFDPERGEYLESRTAPLTVKVKGAVGNAAGAVGASPRAIDVDARPLKSRPRAGAPVGEGPVVAGGLGALLGAVALVALRGRARRQASVAGETRRRREQRARILQGASTRADLSALERAVWDALAERAGDGVRGLPSQELARTLAERGLPEALAALVLAFIRDVEAARYAPGSGGAARRLAEAATTLVQQREGDA